MVHGKSHILRDHVRSATRQRKLVLHFARSSNGRIAVSETVHLGSNPSLAALLDFHCRIVQIVLVYPRY